MKRMGWLALLSITLVSAGDSLPSKRTAVASPLLQSPPPAVQARDAASAEDAPPPIPSEVDDPLAPQMMGLYSALDHMTRDAPPAW